MTLVEGKILMDILFGNYNEFDSELSGKQALQVLNTFSLFELFQYIKENYAFVKPVSADLIPQFSNLNNLFGVLLVVNDSPEKNLTWSKIGYYFCSPDAKIGAKTKYGENHYKLAVQLGLARPGSIALTNLGKALHLYFRDEEIRNELVGRLSMRIPVIQRALIFAERGYFNMLEYLKGFLAESTAIRRGSSIRRLLYLMESITNDKRMFNILWNIHWERNTNELS